jgi:Fic family protein
MPLKKRDTTGGFLPNLRPGDDIGRPATECIRLDGILETRLLSPQLHQVLLGMARLRNAVSSFRLEGETVDLDRARKILEGAKPESPSEIGVHRLANAYSEVSIGKGPVLTIRGLLDAHRTLFKDLIRPEWVGVLKPAQNTIINVGSGSVRFLPTPPERTEKELERLFEWLDQAKYTLPPPVIASLFFAEFEAIHPFMDGNGRLGRLLNIAVLVSLGLRKAALIPLDTRFFRTSDHYYEYLETTNAGTDYHHWARYYVDEMQEAYKAAARQANLGPFVSKFSRGSTRSVLRWVLRGTGAWFSRSDYPNPSGYSQPALWSALNELSKAGVLEQIGEKRGRRYRLRSRFLADVYGRKLTQN